jgi:ComF family protein
MKLKHNLINGLPGDLLSLVYPDLCRACGEPLMQTEEVICTLCMFHLPKTWFHNDPQNPLNKVFWGRVYLEAVTAFYYFHKGSKVQAMMHQFKYNGRKEVGIFIGKNLGLELKHAPVFEGVEVIIPVPLHRKKLKKRGYNQSEMFGMGLSMNMNAELVTDCLIRAVNSQSQTRKSRYKRWENVGNIFQVRNEQKIKNKHVLLVDDVITTGATIEACAAALLKVPGVKVSVAAIAYTFN